jgi:hypothetical protein
VDSSRSVTCSRHLDKTFSSKANFEFAHNGAQSYFPCFSPATHYSFTLNIVACLALSSQFQSLSHLSLSFPQIDSIAQVLLSYTNITRDCFIKGVKSSHFFQIHILCGDRVVRDSPLQIRKVSLGSQSWLKKLPLSSFYQPNRFTEC